MSGEETATDTDTAKAAIRRRMRTVLAGLDARARHEASAALCRRLEELPAWRASRCLLVYLPMAGEPDIEAVATAAAAGGRRICVPRVDWARRRMSPVAIGGFDEAVADPEHPGLRSPPPGPAVEPAEIDLVLVPGLAFDAAGGRLGRGGGFYDRFLPTLPPATVRVGVAFEAQVLPEVPTDRLDARMTFVLTDARCRPAAAGPR